MKTIATFAATSAIFFHSLLMAAPPTATKTTAITPLVMVDAVGKTVGRVAERNWVVVSVNGQNVGLFLYPPPDASGAIFDGSKVAPHPFSQIYFQTSNCSGQAYIPSFDSNFTGSRQSAGIRLAGIFYLYIATSTTPQTIQRLSMFNGGQCQPIPESTMNAVPAGPINLGTLFVEPYTLQ